MNYLNKFHDPEIFIGKTVESIRFNADEHILGFSFKDGSHFIIGHSQDCCENTVSSIKIPLNAFGQTVKNASKIEKKISENYDTESPNASRDHIVDLGFSDNLFLDSSTLTTIALEFENGYKCEFHWIVTSNGYYSEDIDIACIKEPIKHEELGDSA